MIKINYKTQKTTEKTIEIEDIKNCFFKYYNWYKCYVWIYQTWEYVDNFWNIQREYTYLEIQNSMICFEEFRWLECGTFPLRCKIESLLELKEQVQIISENQFFEKKNKLFKTFNKINK